MYPTDGKRSHNRLSNALGTRRLALRVLQQEAELSEQQRLLVRAALAELDTIRRDDIELQGAVSQTRVPGYDAGSAPVPHPTSDGSTGGEAPKFYVR